MGEGFKLLDAYVEVTASGKGVAQKVSSDFAAEVGPATQKMAAQLAAGVDSALQRSTAAKKREEDATGRLRIAELSLTAARQKYPADSLQLVTAEERYAAAQRNSASAMTASKRAATELADAQRKMAASASEAAERVEREAAPRFSKAGSSFGSSMLGGFKGVLGAGVVGGIVSSFGYSIMNQVQNVVGTAFQAAKGAVIDFNSQLENSTIGFTTMLGSAQKANVFLQQLQQFAKTTPFEFSNLVQNAQQMMGMGIAAKDVIPDLTALGDSVASMGGNADQVNQVTLAFDQMAAKGTLDMGNMNQLMQGGVPSALKILASAYGVTTGKMIGMISTGKVQADVALPALVKGIEKGTKATAALGGMMDKQSATFSGAMSNIGDALNQTIAKGFRPFFKIIEKGTQQLATFVSTKRFSNFVNTVATAMTGGLKKVEGFVNGITALFVPAKSPAIKVGGWLKQMSQLKPPNNPLKKYVDDFKASMEKASPSIKIISDRVKDFAKNALPGLIHLFDDLIKLAPKVAQFMADISPVLVPLGKAFTWLADNAIGPLINQIGNFLTYLHLLGDGTKLTKFVLSGQFGEMNAAAGRWAVGIGHHLGDTIRFFQDLDGHIRDAMVAVIGTVQTVGAQIVGGLADGIRGGADLVIGAVQNLVGLIPAWARKILGIASPSKVFHTIGTQVGQGLHLGLLGSVDQIKTTSQKMIDAVMGKGGWAGTTLGSKMVAAIRSDAKVLEALSMRRDKASANLAGAQSNLRQVYSDRASFWGNVSSGVRSSADVTSLYGATTGAAATTLNGVAYQPSYTSSNGLAGVAGNLKGILAATKRFTANLAKLAKMGIDPITYGQLVQAGPMAAIGLSDQLVHDPAGFKQIVSLERQISAAGSALGKQTATRTYAGQLAGAQRAVAADQRTVNHYTFAMTIDAKKIDDLAKLVRMVESVKRTARAR